MITSFSVLSSNMETLFRCFGFSSFFSSPLDFFEFTIELRHCRILILYLRHTGLMIHGAAFFFPIN